MAEKWIKLPPLDQELAKTAPNKARYAQLHMNRVIPNKWFGGSIKPYRNTEEVYQVCLEKGITWEELLNYKPKDEIIL